MNPNSVPIYYFTDRQITSIQSSMQPWLMKSLPLHHKLWALDQISSDRRIVGMAAEMGTNGDLFVSTLLMKSSIIMR